MNTHRRQLLDFRQTIAQRRRTPPALYPSPQESACKISEGLQDCIRTINTLVKPCCKSCNGEVVSAALAYKNRVESSACRYSEYLHHRGTRTSITLSRWLWEFSVDLLVLLRLALSINITKINNLNITSIKPHSLWILLITAHSCMRPLLSSLTSLPLSVSLNDILLIREFTITR